MLLELGRHSFDITTHAITVARTGADVLDLGDDPKAVAAAAHLDSPRAGHARSAEAANALLKAGASLVEAGAASDPLMLSSIADAGASVWLRNCVGAADVVSMLHERARWAEAAGITRSRVIVESPLDVVPDVAALGYPVLVAVEDDVHTRGYEVAAVMNGARIVVTNQATATRRTVFTIGELLARRGVAAPEAVQQMGAC